MNTAQVTAGTTILAIDDDPSTLSVVSRILRNAGYAVALAAEGEAGLARIRGQAPDLVLCDVRMPGLDGFQVLETVRAEAATATVPFVLLTSLDDRDNVRRGMRLGADDFLSKPVRPDELLESVGQTLGKRQRLRALDSAKAPTVLAEARDALEDGQTERTGRMLTQTVLFSDIRGFTTISERLTAGEIAELLSRYLREACKPILHEGGRIMKIMGDGLMAVFGHENPHDAAAHAAAALRAGLGLLQVAGEFRGWVESRFDISGLPPFEVGVGIHTGQVMLFRLSAGSVGDLTAVGDTVNVAARLETKSKELGWPLVASMATIEGAGAGFEVAETREVELPGRAAHILVGRLAAADSGTRRSDVQVPLSRSMEAALEENARSTAEAAKQALDRTLQAIDEDVMQAGTPRDRDPVIRGYRVLEKIGEGAMSVVYLAEDEETQRRAVLKILKGRRSDDDGLWKRFFQECAILSEIDHQHVVRIYDQGFGDEMAYIAMEYLGGGTLRDVMDRGLSSRQSMSLLCQAASALAEIHRRGIVHRDIKPANLMLREEGVLVLTDFGVAKRLDRGAGQTLHGEIVGTPYYISPEQAQAGEITASVDLYSLGVIFHEMLTGRVPYAGATLLELLAQHAIAPIPQLPSDLADFQPLIDGMLAKRPAERFADADALLVAIDGVWTQRALRASV